MIGSEALPLVLTMGDPAGIGPEITLQAWLQRNERCVPPFILLSRLSLCERAAKRLELDVPCLPIVSPAEAFALYDTALPVLELSDDLLSMPGVPSESDASMIVQSITRAVELVVAKKAAAVVTNPINKSVLYDAGFRFPGHTEFLAELAVAEGDTPLSAVMMLAGPGLRTVPLTIHEPLHRVPELITEARIMDTIRIVARDLTRLFAISAPRIAVCGLNPHAGENGGIGTEERDIIAPAIMRLRSEGIDVFGPLPADTMFHASARESYDVAIGMYHDQALIPLKMLAFDLGVNITLGLPFVRTSPDHGTAYDIAGKGIASPSSLIEALRTADAMARSAQYGSR